MVWAGPLVASAPVALIDADHLPRGEEKARAVRGMFDAIAPRYDLLNRLLTFGLDIRWRRLAVESLRLPPGSRVLDLACGTGDLCRMIEDSGALAIGVDVSAGMLEAARTEVPLVQADVLRLPFPACSADGVTCGFALRNLVELPAFFTEMARVTRPGGRIALLEVAEPANAALRWGHRVYFGRVVPAVGGLVSDRSAYRYLPRSMEYLPPPAELVAELRRAGFVGVEHRALNSGIAQLLLAVRDEG